MNREIKFRAWDTQAKKMSPEFVLFGEFLLIGAIHSWQRSIGNGSQGSLKALDDLIVMQFTGLLDKNGKEIYEGDVVNCSRGCPHLVKWDKEIGGTFGGGMPGWHLDGLKKNCGQGYAWTGHEELIGNIHEHPELIK